MLELKARYGWGEAKYDLWPPSGATARRGDLREAQSEERKIQTYQCEAELRWIIAAGLTPSSCSFETQNEKKGKTLGPKLSRL